jgi:hypothetical protein
MAARECGVDFSLRPRNIPAPRRLKSAPLPLISFWMNKHRYSLRSATIGSTFVARRAGM